MNYNDILKVDPFTKQGTRVIKVTPKSYGYRVQMFNNYITLFYLKVIVNPDKSAKIHWRVEKNYNPVYRFTSYHDQTGKEITKKEYKQITNN